MNVQNGSCLCGAVKYELTAEPGAFGYCHCRSCRKASGSSHAANAPIEASHFSLSAGEGRLKQFESSPGKFRVFCGDCGSPIYAYLAASPDLLRIRLGSLDSDFLGDVQAHTWVSEKAAWDSVVDTAPWFAQWADKPVLCQRDSRQDLI